MSLSLPAVTALAGQYSTRHRSDPHYLARQAFLHVYGASPEACNPAFAMVHQALTRALHSIRFADLKECDQLSAAIDLTRQYQEYQSALRVLTGVMNNVGTLSQQLIAHATTGEDLFQLALIAHLPRTAIQTDGVIPEPLSLDTQTIN